MTALLKVHGLTGGYGAAQVLYDISLDVKAAEAVTLLGLNGMGKTTTVKAIMGLIRPWSGRVAVLGRDLAGRPPFTIAQAGLGLVPEGRQVFPTLTVEENLLATARGGPDARWRLDDVVRLFPVLKARRSNFASALSGGEQQMLAIARALMTNPRLMILDEATEGLAPMIRQEIWACLAGLKREGQAFLIIDKNVDALLRLADRHAIIEKGRVVWSGTSAQLASDPAVRDRYLHL